MMSYITKQLPHTTDVHKECTQACLVSTVLRMYRIYHTVNVMRIFAQSKSGFLFRPLTVNVKQEVRSVWRGPFISNMNN